MKKLTRVNKDKKLLVLKAKQISKKLKENFEKIKKEACITSVIVHKKCNAFKLKKINLFISNCYFTLLLLLANVLPCHRR